MAEIDIALTGDGEKLIAWQQANSSLDHIAGHSYITKKYNSTNEIEELCDKVGNKEIFACGIMSENTAHQLIELQRDGYGIRIVTKGCSENSKQYSNIMTIGAKNSIKADELYEYINEYTLGHKRLNDTTSLLFTDMMKYLCSIGQESGVHEAIDIRKSVIRFRGSMTVRIGHRLNGGKAEYGNKFTAAYNTEYGNIVQIKTKWTRGIDTVEPSRMAKHFDRHIEALNNFIIGMKAICEQSSIVDLYNWEVTVAYISEKPEQCKDELVALSKSIDNHM